MLPEQSFPTDFEAVDAVFIEIDEKMIPFFIESSSVRPDKAYIKFEDINSAEAAAEISKKSVFLPKVTREASGRGEFYDDEIIGFEVHDEESGLLGKVTSVDQAGANRLLSIQGADKEILVPINGPFIKSVNKSRKKITVTLPEGFLEI